MNSTGRRMAHGLLLIIVGRASAEGLTVIYDSGDTQPIAPYLEILKDSTEGDDTEAPQIPSLGAADLSQLLPIYSPGLTPGPVTRTAISRPYSAPLFLIGCDPLSARWLAANRSRLAYLGAVGMVVEAPDEAALQRVTELAGGLSLLPASATDLAASLGITHYPVLITRDNFEQ
jgi:integrating conjugative element protein (TIGR03765 family)